MIILSALLFAISIASTNVNAFAPRSPGEPCLNRYSSRVPTIQIKKCAFDSSRSHHRNNNIWKAKANNNDNAKSDSKRKKKELKKSKNRSNATATTAAAAIPNSFSLSFDISLHKDRVLIRCLLAIIIYMAVGAISFSRIFEKWPIIDSLYFSVVTFTTVGYGDLVPTTDASRLFAIFYSLAGISIVGAILGYVGGNVIEAERKAIQKTRNVARAAMMDLFDPKKHGKKKARRGGSGRVLSALQYKKEQSDDNIARLPGLGVLQNVFSRFFAIRTRGDGSKSFLRRMFDTLAECYYIFVPFVSLALFIGKQEGWTLITSIYYAMATASTVGYGDFASTSPRMRLLSLVFIPLAVISLGEILGRIAGYFIGEETKKAEQEFMGRRMTMDDFEAMDTNHDGEIDLFEFLRFMLAAMQKVDNEMMDDLKELYESLDENGSNSIQKEDLILMAQKRRD